MRIRWFILVPMAIIWPLAVAYLLFVIARALWNLSFLTARFLWKHPLIIWYVFAFLFGVGLTAPKG